MSATAELRPVRIGSLVLSRFTARLLAAAVLLALWETLSRLIGGASLPAPWATGTALLHLFLTAQLWAAAGLTLQSTMIGLGIATVIAVPAGLLVASSRFARSSARISIDFLGSIPPISFLPLALLLFGSTMPMKLMVIGYGACWPLLVRTVDARRDVHAVQHDVADAFGLSSRVRWFRVYLPASLPGILVGVRVSLTIALLLSIGCEYVGGAPGIGAELLSAQVDGRSEDVQAFAVVAALMGLVLNQGMRRVERSAIGWHPSVRSTRSS